MTRSLAMKLRVLRAERRLSLREASAVTGVDKVSLSRFERGLAHPQDRTLAKIAEGYGVSFEELLEEEPALAAGKAEGPLSLEWALKADPDVFRRKIQDEPTERLQGWVLDLVSKYQPQTREDLAKTSHEEIHQRVIDFFRAMIINEELRERGEEPPERYVLALKRFMDAAMPTEPPARSHEQPDHKTARGRGA